MINTNTSIIYLFTSPTCPNCPPAKKLIHEFMKTRNDFVLKEFSTMTQEGYNKANKYGVMSVPAFIIEGPGYSQPIGLVGLQTEKSMHKYLDLSYGIEKQKESKSGLKEKLKKGIKIGKVRIKF